MSTTITSSVTVQTSASVITGYGTLGPTMTAQNSFANGTGNNQADMVYFQELTVTNSATPRVINLMDSSLHQPDGSAFIPVEVTEVTIQNMDGSNAITYGGGTTPFNPWLAGTTPTDSIAPSGTMCRVNPLTGWTVNNTADRMTFSVAAGSNVAFKIKITGRSA